MSATTKTQRSENRAKVVVIGGMMMFGGALVALGFGAAVFAAGLWLVLVGVCAEVTES